MTAASTKRPAIEFQGRDAAILAGLFESRLMTLEHVCRLYFSGRGEAAKKRVQSLKMAGFIGERPRRPYQPSILFLTHEGFRAVSSQGLPRHYPSLNWEAFEKRRRVSDMTLAHELQVMDVKSAVSSAAASVAGLDVIEFSTWPVLFQFDARRPATVDRPARVVSVRPDGFFRIRTPACELAFFLEVDRSTEVLETLALRAGCYNDYYRSGAFAQRFYGAPGEDFKSYPFRVLFVLQNAERRNNAAARLLLNTPPIRSQVWLTTLPELEAAALGPIWIRPGDYDAVTDGTAYAPSREPKPYRRRPDREEFVDDRIEKLPLLEAPEAPPTDPLAAS